MVRRRRNHRSFGGGGGTDKPITMMVSILLVGLMVSATLLIANDRAIIVDKIATQLGATGWEIAFFVYISFLVLAVIYDVITDRNGGFGTEDLLGMILIVILPVISFIALQTISVGSISASVNLMITENNEWWFFYAMIEAVFIANKMMVKFH